MAINANLVDYADTTGAAVSQSADFSPETNFIIQAVGAIDSGVEFTVQQAPEQEPSGTGASWATAQGQTPMLTNSNPVAAINYSTGFKYRVTKNATAQAAQIKFYWGHTTVLQSAYR